MLGCCPTHHSAVAPTSRMLKGRTDIMRTPHRPAHTHIHTCARAHLHTHTHKNTHTVTHVHRHTCTASPLSGRPEEEGWDSWSASSSPALEELLRCPPTPERTGVLGRGPPVPAAPVRSHVATDRAEPLVIPNSFENDSK